MAGVRAAFGPRSARHLQAFQCLAKQHRVGSLGLPVSPHPPEQLQQPPQYLLPDVTARPTPRAPSPDLQPTVLGSSLPLLLVCLVVLKRKFDPKIISGITLDEQGSSFNKP